MTQNNKMTGIWFDTCLRLKNTIEVMLNVFGNRKLSIARELTKVHEEIIISQLDNVIQTIEEREKENNPLKGEIVLILEGCNNTKEIDFEMLSFEIKYKLKTLSLRDTVNEITFETKLPRKIVYREAMKVKNNS